MSLTVDHFTLQVVLGKGRYGKVVLAKKKDTQLIYAMKLIKKSNLKNPAKYKQAFTERNVMVECDHPFIMPLKYSFES
jgi:serine/threonine protein kinase